jgi:CheY-like chemotaxis protein
LPQPVVIVVDDEEVIADTLVAILNRSGFRAQAVYCGMAAVSQAREVRPDIIISDVVMPDISGIEVAIQVRAMLPGCKVLLFSGQAGTNDLLADARAAGYEFEVLAKPIHPSELLAKVQPLSGS